MTTPNEPNLFMDLFFYWLAALPLLIALLVWLYFWRQKYLVKIMLMNGTNCNICPNSDENGHASSSDKPPSYDLYESYPTVEKIENDHHHVAVTVDVDDDEEVPPPTYLDAIVKIKKNKGHHISWGQRSSLTATRPEVGEPNTEKKNGQAESTPSVKTIQAKNGKELESSQNGNGDDNS